MIRRTAKGTSSFVLANSCYLFLFAFANTNPSPIFAKTNFHSIIQYISRSVNTKKHYLYAGYYILSLICAKPCICYVHPAEAGLNQSPPLCKGRWHFLRKMTEGLLLTSPFPFFVISVAFDNPSVSFTDSSLYTREPFNLIRHSLDSCHLPQGGRLGS